MSLVAEFAHQLHTSHPAPQLHELVPIELPARANKLVDMRAVIFDVYGTLVDYWRPEFGDEERKASVLQQAFSRTIERFGIGGFLTKMNAEEAPEKTLQDLYHGLIALAHEKSRDKGIEFPEVKIEEIWYVILLMLRRHGFDPAALALGEDRDVARCMAYHYNFFALKRGFYPGVVEALERLKGGNLLLGIVSNAQFYTPMDLTFFTRDQSEDRHDDYLDLFEQDLVVYSFDEGSSKPGGALFRRLYDALYQYQILPEQTLFVGNDLAADIKPAQEAGMKTALFTGDRESTFLHDLTGTVVPDIVFGDWSLLPQAVSFHTGKEGHS